MSKVITLGHISVPLNKLFDEEFSINGNVYTSGSNTEYVNAIYDKDGNIVLGIDRKGEVSINIKDAGLRKKFIKYFIQTIVEKIEK